MSGHGRHHAGTAHRRRRPGRADVRDTNLPGSLQSRPRAWPSRPRGAGFALRHPGRFAVNRCRLASWRHGSRYPPQRCGGSLPRPYGQACRRVRCGHGRLRRARCGTQDETRRRLRSGDGRDTRLWRTGYSEAHCSREPGRSGTRRVRKPGWSGPGCSQGPGCRGTRCSRKPGCSEVRCSPGPGWSPVVRLRRPGESSRGSRHPCVPTEHGDPGPSWRPRARHRRPEYGCYVRPGSWRASGIRPRTHSGLSGGYRRRPCHGDGPGWRRQLPAVPGHSCQRAWRPSKPSGSRYLIPGSSASRIPRPRSSTSSFNTTQTSEEGRSTLSGATLFKTCPAASYSPTRSPAQYHRR